MNVGALYFEVKCKATLSRMQSIPEMFFRGWLDN